MKNFWHSLNAFLKKYHIIKLLFTISLLMMLLLSSYLIFLAKITDVKNLQNTLSHRTIIYDESGNEAGQLLNQKGTYIGLNDVSPYFIDGVIATEDQRFYDHKGYDVMGIARASISFLTSGFSKDGGGGSTLTQQLAKNAYLTQKQSFLRKFQELFLAIEIEKHYSKDDILTMYINHAYFGEGVWGVEDASHKYFGKSAKVLNVQEAAMLTGMLKGPNLYNPYNNEQVAKNRRDTVLEVMLGAKKITQQQYDEAVNTTIQLNDTYHEVSHYRYPYYFDAVIAEAVDVYGISEDDLYTKGYKIYTSLNQNYQKTLETHAEDETLFPNNPNVLVQNAAMVTNPKTGGIQAIVGGRGKHVYRGFNRAYQMHRQPGSVLKPLVVYTPALEMGYTPRSVLLDEVVSYGSDQYTPQNWDYQTVGSLPMYQALALSKNTSAVWLLNEIGIDKGLEKLSLFGIETTPDDRYLGVALGGMTKGTTVKAINEAYTAFANDGVRLESYLITKIEDVNGEVVTQKTFTTQHHVMDATVASQMTQMMMGVYQDGGTAPMATYNNLKIAGKTGTTESTVDSSDMWAVGYTKDFVYTTWIGYDETTDENYLKMNEGDSIKPLFKETINDLLAHSPQTPFNLESVHESVVKEQEEAKKRNWFQSIQENVGSFVDQQLNHLKSLFKQWFP
ncbi:PBP1A family penicillin-binding protein [Carnobacteriaceae bacterium zg-ZUI240]|nr:PBP1A family penicillin-binding protein [Carnobacteriaceae bacterium zg-ZUI240]